MYECWCGSFFVQIAQHGHYYHVMLSVQHYPQSWETSLPAKGRLDYVLCTDHKKARGVAAEMLRQATEYRGNYVGMHGYHAFAERLDSRQGCEDVGLRHFERVGR